MSKQPETPYIGITGIARILNVGESRVRQLVTSPDFPKPWLSLGPRTRFWSAAVIREWDRSAQDKSRVAAISLPVVDPDAALPRIIDEFVTARLDGYPWHSTVYVRAFRGPDYTIAMISKPVGTYGMNSHLESIMKSILFQLKALLGPRVCWIIDYPEFGPGEIANPVVTVWPDNTVTDQERLPITYEELTARIGEPVEMYTAERMTEDMVQRFKDGGPVAHDRNDDSIRKLTETIRILEGSTLPANIRAHCLDVTAHALLSVARLASSTGGQPADAYRYPSRISWAVMDHQRELHDVELELANRYALQDGPGWFELDELNESTAKHLTAWMKSIDEYSATPDPRTHERLSGLSITIAMHIRDTHVRDLVQEEQAYSDEQRVVICLSTRPHILRYLQGAARDETPRDRWRREHRTLAAKVGSDAEFSRDRFGNLLAISPTSPTLAVLWPRHSNTPAAKAVLLDGTVDTIAYLLDENDQPIGLLPRIKRPGSIGWASGYTGTGASDLMSAIKDYVEASGLPDSTARVYKVVSDRSIAETTTIPL